MIHILGIDPGFRTTGYGFIKADAQKYERIASGCIRTDSTTPLSERLCFIYKEMGTLILAHRPEEVAIEDVFVARSPGAALKLGQARAAALLAAANQGLLVAEYQPRKVKKSVVGTGNATKEQVQLMVRMLLNLAAPLQADAADALAIAICHANYRHTAVYQHLARKGRSTRAVRVRRGRAF